MSSISESFFIDMWYQRRWWAVLFLPLSWIYAFLSLRRKGKLLEQQQTFPVPVVVVGNISVGGTGKTPLTITLVEAFKSAGLKPAIVSRGYGSNAPHYPYIVRPDSEVTFCGDEPLLLARRCQCPVIIDADRCAAIKLLLEQHQVDVIISDDGLQHYRMPRAIEIAVVDAQRGVGNGWWLPAGPLREGVQRLQSVDFAVINGEILNSKVKNQIAPYVAAEKIVAMQVSPLAFINLGSNEDMQISDHQNDGLNQFSNKTLRAVSGIGNPQRFFQLLDEFGLNFKTQIFPDHHQYVSSDLDFPEDVILTTEKDAVKLHAVLKNNIDRMTQIWYLKVAANVDTQFTNKLIDRISHNPTYID